MSALGPSVVGARVLDLFAGSGALGLEALSRGAEHAVFVERAKGALRALDTNIEKLGAASQCTVVRGDALTYLDRLPDGPFDLVLADPPYGTGIAAELVRRFEQDPFANELWVEHRRSDDVPVPPDGRQRRYGDTVLTTIFAGP